MYKQRRKVYLVGRVLPEMGSWGVISVFSNQKNAIAACFDEECFYVPIQWNEIEIGNVSVWENAVFPKA